MELGLPPFTDLARFAELNRDVELFFPPLAGLLLVATAIYCFR